MTALLLFVAYSVFMCSAAFLLGACMSHCDAQEQPSAPEWPSGDEAWLADQPAEVLVDDEQVRQLERTWLL